MTVDVSRNFSSCHPLGSSGITRFQRYYGVIRLLCTLRPDLMDRATAFCGRTEISRGKTLLLHTIPAPSTWCLRLDIGLRNSRHAHPGHPACAGVHFRSVWCFAPGFHPTPPHGFTIGYPQVGAAAFHVRFPPAGSRGTFTLRISAVPGAPRRPRGRLRRSFLASSHLTHARPSELS